MRCRAAGLLFWLSAVPFLVPAQTESPGDPNEKKLIEAIRLSEIFKSMAIKPGDMVADVGAGDGIYTIPLARAVGAAGRVYAVDIDEERALKPLRHRVEQSKLENINVVHGLEDDPKLSPGAFDAIMLIDAYHWLTNAPEVVRHLYEALKPGGRLVLVDFMPPRPRPGVRIIQTEKHSLDPGIAEKQLRTAGFSIRSRDDHFIENPKVQLPMWMLVAIRP